MLSTTCHCGAVEIRIPHAPAAITNCSCSICRRYGVLWAYFDATDVEVIAEAGVLVAYDWGVRQLRFVRCGHCGCVSHWEPTDAKYTLRRGVNARNFDPLMLGNVRIRRLDGACTERYLDE